jgi:bifunctional non-homologous end joining protein LigD
MRLNNRSWGDSVPSLDCLHFQLRREPIEVRKATLPSILRKSRPGVRLNEHLKHLEGVVVFQHACKMGLEGIVSKRLGSPLPVRPVS